MHTPPVVLSLVVLLALGKIVWAVTVSSMFGMGLGHWIIEQEHDGRVFRNTQMAGLAAADRQALAAARKPRVGIVPVMGNARRGLALSVNF